MPTAPFILSLFRKPGCSPQSRAAVASVPATAMPTAATKVGPAVQAELDKQKFYSKPRLGLDAVGGASAQRLSEALADGAQLVVYGAMSGKAAQFSWHQWVFQGIQVRPVGRQGCVYVCVGGGAGVEAPTGTTCIPCQARLNAPWA